MTLPDPPPAPAPAALASTGIGAREFRAARRIVTRADGSATRSAGLERLYLVVVVLGVVGFPTLRAVTLSLSTAWAGKPAEGLGWIAVGAVGVLLVAVAALPTAIGLVTAPIPTIAFFVRGPFGVRRTLVKQTRVKLFVVASAAATLGVCLAIASAAAPASIVTAGAGGIGVGAVVSILSVAAQGRRRSSARRVALVLGLALVIVGLAGSSLGWATGILGATGIGAVAVLLLPAAFLLGRLLDEIDPAVLEADAERRATAAAGIVVGDTRSVIPPVSPEKYRARRLPFVVKGGLVERLVRRDLRGLRRLPAPSAATGIVVALAAALVASNGLPVVGLVAGLAVQGAVGLWVAGLRDHVEHVGSDVLDRGSFRAKYAAHLVVPLLLALSCATVGSVCGAIAAGTTGTGILIGVGLVLVGLAARIWLAASGTAPLWVNSPVPTPAGDLAGVVFLVWTGRGILPLVVFAVVAGSSGALAGTAVALALAALLVGWSIVRLRRDDP